jgi:hypothetical protein
MAFTATKFLSVRGFPYPLGQDSTQRSMIIRGSFVENDTSTEYSVGGIGSTSFEVTAFSSVGLVTYSSLKGAPLYNGQRVVVYNTSSNTNDGTYIVSAITATTTTSGTFIALAIPGKTLAASSQTGQTAEGVGQIQFGIRYPLTQTFTATAVTVAGPIATITYTTLTGPQLWGGDIVVIAGMTNAGNNGTFTINAAYPTSSTAGSFTITNTTAVATDSGTGTGTFKAGVETSSAAETPTQVNVFTSKGWVYLWDNTNYTIRIFTTGTASGDILNEATLGASVAWDGTITFEAIFAKYLPS